MATFTVGFLGCKVSQTDVQEIRERLAADGHVESDAEAEIAVVNTCCVTHEAVRKSRQAARRAARRARRVYVTGCGASLAGDAFAGLPANVTVVSLPGERTPEFVARDVGAIGCVRADIGLDRVRAFVKVQDGCSFSCAFCVIPQVRGASRSRSAEAVLGEVRRRVEARPRRGRAHGDQPRLLPGPRGRLRPPAARSRGRRGSGSRTPSPLLDRGQPPRRGADRRDARDADGVAAPSRPAPVGRRPRAEGHGPEVHERHVLAAARPRRGIQLDRRRDRRLPGRGRRRVRADARSRRGGRPYEGARLSVLASAGNPNGGRRLGPARESRRSGARACGRCQPRRAGGPGGRSWARRM